MVIQYTPKGVCSQGMKIELEDGMIRALDISGGCSGNLQGISRLLIGMPAEEAISRLEGIRCGTKKSSCPDQLAQALKSMEHSE